MEEASRVMIKNQIHKLPVVGEGKLLGVVTITDLAVFLSPSRRSGLALSVLQANSRGKWRFQYRVFKPFSTCMLDVVTDAGKQKLLSVWKNARYFSSTSIVIEYDALQCSRAPGTSSVTKAVIEQRSYYQD